MVPPFDAESVSEEIVGPVSSEEIVEPVSKEGAAETLPGNLSLSDLDEILEFMRSNKGRGRKSFTPDDFRFHTVRDWMMMQKRGTSVRLQDFLDERFGTYDNGMPKVPRNTFNGWQRQFKEMVREYIKEKESRQSRVSTPGLSDRP
jgi:hypothetical protein